MPLKIYNSLSKKKEDFVPLKAGHVNMYVCGVTVYDYCHLGHARAGVIFDMVYRYLLASGYDVNYVRNFTDIDDKIIKRANENNESWQDLTSRFITAFYEDMDALGLKRPTHEPKATEYIEQMQTMIKTLIDKGYAYTGAADVYYKVRAKKDYGKLSNKDIDDLASGSRIEIDEAKTDPLDFVLWKAAKPNEPQWDSPWGAGRPGWHIECSAMSTHLLGETFDIHGGGRDLTFPHHENEIAQSEGATGKLFARYWMHNGFVNLNADKMSKSTGNMLNIRDALKQYPAEVLRYFLLSSHYSSPLDFNDAAMKQSEAALERVYTCKQLAKRELVKTPVIGLAARRADEELVRIAELKEKFKSAMDDDFNSAQSFGYLFEVVREVYKLLGQSEDKYLRAWAAHDFMVALDPYEKVLGLFIKDPDEFLASLQELKSKSAGMGDSEIESLIAERNAARAAKNWKRADEIRDLLLNNNVEIKDLPSGTSWVYK